jgi:hypothetical protein
VPLTNAERRQRYAAHHPDRVRASSQAWLDRNPEFKVWQNMRARCYDSNHDHYLNYGGRGIAVCKRWQSFKNFLADMGKRPSPRHSIERRENDGNYTLKNCKWAVDSIQRRNTRRNHWIKFAGRTQCLHDWARELGIWPNTIYRRLRRGLSDERALTC